MEWLVLLDQLDNLVSLDQQGPRVVMEYLERLVPKENKVSRENRVHLEFLDLLGKMECMYV